MWGPAVAGTNDEGETYESNIIKESGEEIGLKNFSFKKTSKNRVTGNHNYFCQWFYAVVDKDITEFKVQKEEVEEVKWFKKDELIKEFGELPDQFLKSIKKYVANLENK